VKALQSLILFSRSVNRYIFFIVVSCPILTLLADVSYGHPQYPCVQVEMVQEGCIRGDHGSTVAVHKQIGLVLEFNVEADRSCACKIPRCKGILAFLY